MSQDDAPMGRFQPPEVRCRQVLDAARELLVQVGYERMSVSAVARRAGIAKGTVYLYFDSKAAILAALQAELVADMVALPALDDPRASWPERLDALVAHWLQLDLSHADVYAAVFAMSHDDQPDHLVACLDLLRRIVEGGIEEGVFDVEDIDETVRMLFHGYSGVAFAKRDGPADAERLTGVVQRLWRRVVGLT